MAFFEQYDYNWRISLSLAGLQTNWFFTDGLPIPASFNYEGYSERVPLGQGGDDRQGYKNIFIGWDVTDALQSYYLKNVLESAITAGVIYMTVPRNDGDKCKTMDWIDVSGVPVMPVFSSPEKSRGIISTGIELVVTNITIENDPATGIFGV